LQENGLTGIMIVEIKIDEPNEGIIKDIS